MSPIQRPTPRAPAQPLGQCLGHLERQWQSDGSLAALWQDWPRIAGAHLSPHCQPLSLQRGILTIGASHPQWRQALQYSRSQLLASLRAAGHTIQDLRVQQHHPTTTRHLDTEASIWARHPSRADVHGMGSCPLIQEVPIETPDLIDPVASEQLRIQTAPVLLTRCATVNHQKQGV